MERVRGRSIPVSPYRRVVTDLMHFSQQVPAVTAERPMDLSPLVAARAAALDAPVGPCSSARHSPCWAATIPSFAVVT